MRTWEIFPSPSLTAGRSPAYQLQADARLPSRTCGDEPGTKRWYRQGSRTFPSPRSFAASHRRRGPQSGERTSTAFPRLTMVGSIPGNQTKNRSAKNRCRIRQLPDREVGFRIDRLPNLSSAILGIYRDPRLPCSGGHSGRYWNEQRPRRGECRTITGDSGYGPHFRLIPHRP
jgi:hypothetical protein